MFYTRKAGSCIPWMCIGNRDFTLKGLKQKGNQLFLTFAKDKGRASPALNRPSKWLAHCNFFCYSFMVRLCQDIWEPTPQEPQQPTLLSVERSAPRPSRKQLPGYLPIPSPSIKTWPLHLEPRQDLPWPSYMDDCSQHLFSTRHSLVHKLLKSFHILSLLQQNTVLFGAYHNCRCSSMFTVAVIFPTLRLCFHLEPSWN